MHYIPPSCTSSPCNTCVSVVVYVARKLRPCPSYSRRRDRINLVLWRSLDKGGGGYMKGGQMVTHPCAPLPRIEFGHLQVVGMCNCSAWCMIARRVSKLNICRLRILHCLCQHGCEPEIFMFPRLSCVCPHLEMWARCTHTMRMRMCVPVVICVVRKLRPCPSYSGCRDRNNSIHWRSLHKGGGGR